MASTFISLSIVIISLLQCKATERRQKAVSPPFAAGVVVGKVDNPVVNEASGLAASRVHPGLLYTHNDHGDGPRIYVLNASDASVVATLTIAGAQHTDWEDIAVGPCKGGSVCIYIGDIGYGSHGSANVIYRVVEPEQITDGSALPIDSKVSYSWVESESQTLLVDNNEEVYIIGNVNGGRGMISHIPNTEWGNQVPVFVNSFVFLPIHTHHHDPVAGDISADGSELLIKSQTTVFYFQLSGSLMNSMQQFPAELPYTREHTGEAICWSADGNNYYTLAEGVHSSLYLYRRLPDPSIVG